MKHYVTPVLVCLRLNEQDAIRTSSTVEYDVSDWIQGGVSND